MLSSKGLPLGYSAVVLLHSNLCAVCLYTKTWPMALSVHIVTRFSSRLMFLRGEDLGRPYLRSSMLSHLSQSFCARAMSGFRYGWR